ncbi:hypothetical protein GCM10010218_00010 [Streptomyces mashuensis]|uniref:DegT/DnrJ/EryC1/StrS aminotransferase n=1 Tax=Streptomyces mashuensis TaxID=33904 RepID=A0A919AUC9_9ACTN|nr:DegT/DnrJ/EryC1/StrS family aminotransferase [Streptomyces mashuensis]GHF23602.1 hypothetical protein GCM10010218_00010 [Streptomyces mashuensis]
MATEDQDGRALTARLTAAGIGAGDEVVVPSFAPAEPALAVQRAGARPVFADIDPGTFCIDPAAAAEAITSRTAAVVAVALFGHPADLEGLGALAGRHGLLLLGQPDPADLGPRPGHRHHAAYLNTHLTGVITPTPAPGTVHCYSSYVVRVPGNGRPDRDVFARALRARGVRAHVPVPTPVHRLPPFQRELWLPEAERAAAECLALPLHEAQSRRELQRLVAACNALGGALPAAAA